MLLFNMQGTLKKHKWHDQISISLSSLRFLCCICSYYEQLKKTELHCAALRAMRLIEITPVRAMQQEKKPDCAVSCLSSLMLAMAYCSHSWNPSKEGTHFSSFANLIPLVVMGSRKNQSNPGKYLYIWKEKCALVAGTSRPLIQRALTGQATATP